mmetsp:Transcript_8189/g.25891  ORF Transcript_8189/g.25891 Transcript_8189/m.25891 type:complete len:271 (+) Transcript_8189:200-1012(+)
MRDRGVRRAALLPPPPLPLRLRGGRRADDLLWVGGRVYAAAQQGASRLRAPHRLSRRLAGDHRRSVLSAARLAAAERGHVTARAAALPLRPLVLLPEAGEETRASSGKGKLRAGALFLLPESPRYLQRSGRAAQAAEVLRRMALLNGRPPPPTLPDVGGDVGGEHEDGAADGAADADGGGGGGVGGGGGESKGGGVGGGGEQHRRLGLRVATGRHPSAEQSRCGRPLAWAGARRLPLQPTERAKAPPPPPHRAQARNAVARATGQRAALS